MSESLWRRNDLPAAEISAELFERMHDGVALYDSRSRLVGWNQAAATISGWQHDEASTRLDPQQRDGLAELSPGRWVDLRRITFQHGEEHYVGLLFSDARTHVALQAAYAKLNQLATTDPLTGLPNRLLAQDRLRLSLAMARRDDRCVAVLFIDLDRFKAANDTMGHHVGDRVLKEVADRLSRVVRESDTAARVGGDEFMVILHTLADESGAVRVAESILEALSVPIVIDGRTVPIGSSIGIALAPRHGDDPETLIRHADLAMYRAKASGGHTVRVYWPGMSDLSQDRLELTMDLAGALERDELEVHYQPQTDADTGMVVGAEALVRWRHPRAGLIPPDAFLPLAEENGTIEDIDRWVLRTACRQAAQWREEGLQLPLLSVNLSTRSVVHANAAAMVADALESSGLPAACLEVEVSETTLVAHRVEASRSVARIKDLGVRIAVDHFGATSSSLGSLTRLPLDTLKLDRSFVVDAIDNPEPADMAVLRAIVQMTEDLQVRCVAEGVELPAQLKFLRFLRCHVMQGFLYSRPLPANDMEALLTPLVGASA